MQIVANRPAVEGLREKPGAPVRMGNLIFRENDGEFQKRIADTEARTGISRDYDILESP